MDKKNIFYLLLLMSLFFYKTVYSDELISILREYEEYEAEKTKNETLGKVFVFTRTDFERLQINTLADLLRNIPSGYVYPNSFGVNQFVYSRLGATGIVYAIRVYLDGHELSSIHTSSPFLTYDNFPIDNIEKAEVYISFSPSNLSAENGLMIVKLYSKDPSKENIRMAKSILDSKKGYSLTFSDARQISLSTKYFLLVNVGKLNFSKPIINNNELNRNQNRKHLYFKLSYLDTDIQFSISDVKRGLWGGFSSDFSPDYGKIRSTDIFMTLSQKLLNDKSLKILASYDRQFRNYKEINLDTGLLYSPYINRYGTPIYIDEDRIFTKFTVNIQKEIKSKNKNLKLNLIHSDYEQNVDLNKGTYPGGKVLYDYKPDYEDYMSFFSIVGSYNQKIKENLKFVLEGKVSYFHMHKNSDFNTFDKKIGFIYKINKHFLKLLVSEINITPSLILMESAKDNLRPMVNRYFMVEDRVNFDKFGKLSLVFSRARIKNLIHPTREGVVNDSKKYYGNFYLVDYSKKFDIFKLSIAGWLNDFDMPKFTPEKGINFRVYGKKENINYFVLLLYRGAYKNFGIKIDETYDLSLGISCNFNNGFSIKFKGENILDKSTKVIYIRPVARGTYKSVDRRFLITLEKVF